MTFMKCFSDCITSMKRARKKCRELDDVVNELKQCIECDSDGVRPVRASGSRWVTHKLSAMKRIDSKFGVYAHHLTSLTRDSTVKPADRVKPKGYLNKWVYLSGYAFFIDLLLPCSIFSKVLQSDDLDVLGAFSSLLRTAKELERLSAMGLECWPTYSATLKKLVGSDDGETTYQLTTLTHVQGPWNITPPSAASIVPL